MTEMSFEASKLIDAGREAFRPTDADRARVFAAVMTAAPLVGGAAVIGVSKVSWAGLVELVRTSRAAQVLAVAMPVAAAGGLTWYATVHQPVEAPIAAPRAPVLAPPAARLPPPAEEPSTPRDEVSHQIPDPASAQAVPRPTPPTADSSSTAGQIREEVALLTRAQAELSRGRPHHALDALKEHAQRFPRGALSSERIATRARALCALGRTAEAEAELARVERMSPGSPYWARAREACRGR
jgi:hypothetical protein